MSGLIAFVQQLLREGRLVEALRAAQALIEREPLHPLGHAVLGGLLVQARRPLDALGQIELAARLGMSKDADLWQNMAAAAAGAGLPAHIAQAARNGLAVAPTIEGREQFAKILATAQDYFHQMIGDTPLSDEQAEKALLLTEQSTRDARTDEQERARRRAAEAIQLAPTWPVVWQHQATLLFGMNDLLGAVAACEEGLAQIPGSPTLLALLVRLYAVSGRQEAAEAALAQLEATPTPGAETAEEVAKGLAALDRDQAIVDLLAPYAGEGGGIHNIGRFLLGAALANLGRADEARAAWRPLVRDSLAHVRAFLDMLARHEEPPTPRARFPYFAAVEQVPSDLVSELVLLAQRDLDADFSEAAAPYTRLADALCEAFFLQGLDPRLALDLLLRLGDPDASDAARRFATSRLLGEYDRVFAHLALRGAGLDDPESRASVWINGRRRDLLLPALRIIPVPPLPYDEEVTRLLNEAGEMQQEDGAARAVDLYTQLLAAHPDVVEAEHNLGTALMLTARIEEGEAHLRRALELRDDYLLARANLAALELSRGNVPAAHHLLDPLDGRVTYTLEEVLAYLRVRADLAWADGDLERAETLLHALLAYDHENEMARERLKALAPRAVRATG